MTNTCITAQNSTKKESDMNTKTYEYLDRFLNKQKHIYETALEELKRGKKESHWMWYIFPQLRGLGESNISFIYGIISIKEAKEYLSNPILRARLDECCNALLLHKDKTAVDILGDIDAIKLQSSMTLFALISDEGSVFHQVLNQFFDGELDKDTQSLLFDNDGFFIENGTLRGYYGDKEDIVIPDTVTDINGEAFYKCIYINSVTLPSSVKSIGAHAFACCENLRSINIPESVDSIGHCAFSGCKSLSDDNGFVIVSNILFSCYQTEQSHIVIPEGVSEIDSYALTKCHKNMQTVVLPKDVKAINPHAFWRCSNLQQIVIPDTVNAIAKNAFNDCKKLTIFAPVDSYAEAFAHHLGIPFKELCE